MFWAVGGDAFRSGRAMSRIGAAWSSISSLEAAANAREPLWSGYAAVLEVRPHVLPKVRDVGGMRHVDVAFDLLHRRRRLRNGTEAKPRRFAVRKITNATHAASQGRPRCDSHSAAEPCLAFRPIASAWGNQRFAAPTNDEVCLAAEQHDIGWLRWEAAPVLDARTGLPQEFCHVPAITHTALWREGVRRARAFGRYPALLVSLHADTIYALTFNFAKASPANAEAVRAFLDEQHRFQAQMAASLRADPKIADQASPETIERNRLLIAAFDRMSLEICWGVTKELNNYRLAPVGSCF
jgi:hypothetical protein